MLGWEKNQSKSERGRGRVKRSPGCTSGYSNLVAEGMPGELCHQLFSLWARDCRLEEKSVLSVRRKPN